MQWQMNFFVGESKLASTFLRPDFFRKYVNEKVRYHAHLFVHVILAPAAFVGQCNRPFDPTVNPPL